MDIIVGLLLLAAIIYVLFFSSVTIKIVVAIVVATPLVLLLAKGIGELVTDEFKRIKKQVRRKINNE